MASSDDDDELHRAIALSLQETHTAASPDETDYDRDLRLAMALSLEGANGAAKNNVEDLESSYAKSTVSDSKEAIQNPIVIAPSSTSPSTAAPTPKPAFLLDRKAMEQERLARLGKRKRPPSPDLPSKQVVKQTASVPSPPPPSAIQFPHGAIKRTYAYKHPRTSDITISEVLQPSTLNIAVLSSFQWDNEWIFHHADPRRIKQLWIMGAKDDELKTRIREDVAAMNLPGLKAHFPPLKQGCMHSKLMLLFHPTHLRVVVPTANLMKVEWGETGQRAEVEGTWQPGVLENTVFLIDLPRREDGGKVEKLQTGFGRELVTFLEAQEVGRNVVDGLHKFDFSQTDKIALVHSMQVTPSTSPSSRTPILDRN